MSLTTPLDHQPDRPNLLLLVLDTQRADHLSCYGYPLPTSPELDKLAAEATRFAWAVAPAQWTVPTHASLFTGLYPSQHTAYQMDSVLPAELTTLPERLQQAGYRTAGFSHNPLIGVVQNGLQRGYDQFTNYRDVAAGLLALNFSQESKPTTLAGRLRRGLRLTAAELLGYSQRTWLKRLAPAVRPLWRKGLELTGKSKAGQTRQTLAAVSKLLRERPDGRPVFAFVNLMGAHVPYDPPRWAVERFMATLPGGGPADDYLQRANQWQVDPRHWLASELKGEEYQAIVNACYDAEIAAQDAEIGSLVRELRTAGVLDNTLLVIVADHGDHLGERDRFNHMFGVYQALAHVPLLIRDPSGRLPQGGVVESFVSTRRVCHTLLAAAGAATIEEENLALWPGNPFEPDVFSEGYPLQWAIRRIEKERPGLVHTWGYDQPVRAIYRGKHKLITWGQQKELYALPDDPLEANDLSQQLPGQVNDLETQLQHFRQRMEPVATAAYHEEVDPAVLDHLRSLGYIE